MASEELQAVAAAVPPPPPTVSQVDHLDHHGMQPLAPQPVQAAPVDSLTCQWTGCGERCQTPEALYDHVCERHIGRKSTNNLNLTCQWGACRTTTVKRDHITSHMRVHVPLKPHKCDFCGKSFKRPQDLKKHVKTHADDSVLLRSPDNSLNQQPGASGYPPQDNKNAFFQNGHDMSAGPYPPSSGQTNNSYYPNPQQYSGYGQVNYPGANLGDQQSMDTRRRAIEALNDFLGDVKRRALDPTSYYDVGQRLSTTSLPLPVSSGNGYSLGNGNGYGGNNQNHAFNPVHQLMDSFGGSSQGMPMNGGGGGGVHAPLTQNYSLPMSNARTKNDLLDIDRFLEQLQATVYESSNQAAAAGIQQPGSHAQLPTNFGFNNYHRHSNSPPQFQHHSSNASASQPLTSVAQMASMTAHAQGLDTPALTPASVSSYQSSGQSPMSSHSRSSGDGASMYPQLPSVTGMSDMGAGYTSAPPSGLASGFDGFEGRRYSGGRLQREAPGPRRDGDAQSDAMDLDEEQARTPRKEDASQENASPSNVDPALRSPQPEQAEHTPSRSESVDDRTQEAWVENVRVIETLRNWIKDRLAQSDFERDQDSTPEPADHQRNNDIKLEQALVDPNIDPNMDPALGDNHEDRSEPINEEISYPMLKSEA